jgi:hypothetical protein
MLLEEPIRDSAIVQMRDAFGFHRPQSPPNQFIKLGEPREIIGGGVVSFL